MKESLMQEKDYDGDGKVETGSQEYLGSRDKAIKKAMANEQGIKSVMRGAKNIAKKAGGAAGAAAGVGAGVGAAAGKAIKKATKAAGGGLRKMMGKMNEKTVFYTDDKDRTRVFDDNQ